MTQDPPSLIPLSPALAEASPESLTEFLSRHPETYTPQDLIARIEVLRAQRARWEQAEGKPKVPKTKAGPKALKAQSTLDDLGL